MEIASEQKDLASIKNPHDLLFKAYMKHLPVARDCLEIYLPEHLVQHCDFSTLRLHDTAFSDTRFNQFFSDIVYTLEIAGQLAYIHVIVEHQSTPDKMMHLRVAEYALAILRQHYEEHDEYPIIEAIVFFNGGDRPWPYSTNLRDYRKSPELSEDVIPHKFNLVNLPEISCDKIVHHKSMTFLELILKHAKGKRNFAEVLECLRNYQTGDLDMGPHDIMMMAFRYALIAIESQEIFNELTRLAPAEYKGDIMTLAEQFVEKGRQEGRQEGWQEERQETVHRLISMGITDVNFISEASKLEPEIVEAIMAIEGNS